MLIYIDESKLPNPCKDCIMDDICDLKTCQHWIVRKIRLSFFDLPDLMPYMDEIFGSYLLNEFQGAGFNLANTLLIKGKHFSQYLTELLNMAVDRTAKELKQ